MIDPEKITPEQADQAEKLVDKRGYSYDDAYRELGLVFAPNKIIPSERENARNEARDYYADEFRLTGELTPEQSAEAQKAMRIGMPAVRAALDEVNQRPPVDGSK